MNVTMQTELIPVEMLQIVLGGVRKRLTEWLERTGGHLNEVIFGK
jgi:hypothetical protein